MTSIILPMIVLIIILYAVKKRQNIYNDFIEGSKESFNMVLNMFPCLLAMIFGVNIFLRSGILEFIYLVLKPLFKFLMLDIELLPMIILRPISGSASLAVLNNIYLEFGVDSLKALYASVIQGATDTTFYIITLYYGSVGIKKIRHSLLVGLLADLVGIIAAVMVTRIFFN